MRRNKILNVEDLKAKGLSCAKLRSMEKDKFKDAQTLRKIGLLAEANAEENIGRSLRNKRKRLCILK